MRASSVSWTELSVIAPILIVLVQYRFGEFHELLADGQVSSLNRQGSLVGIHSSLASRSWRR